MSAGDYWTYRGVDVWRAGVNSSGIRWYARMTSGPVAIVRADTKQGMRDLIRTYGGAR